MKALYNILLSIGLVLLGINIFGLFKTMRNPDIYTEEYRIRNRLNDVMIPYPAIKKMLHRNVGETDIDFAYRINKVVHDGFAHYWRNEGIDKYHLRVPVWENYMLYAASYIKPKQYLRYEFSDYRKNLERGAGLCSAHAIILKGVMMENGIKAELLDVGKQHVVTRVEFDNRTAYIFDPDFGIAVPHDTAAISTNPELVREPYANMADLYYPDAVDPYTTEKMVKIFGMKKYVYEVNNPFEFFSYWAKWIVPLLLIMPYCYGKLFHRGRSTQSY